MYQTFIFSSDILGHHTECKCNVLIFCFNLIPDTMRLLKKTLRTLYYSSPIFVFVFVVLFKEFCSLYFHDNPDQRNLVLVLCSKGNPRFEVLI